MKNEAPANNAPHDIIKSDWRSRILLSASLLLILFLSICYTLHPDALAAFTTMPIWSWFIVGLLLTAFGWNRKNVFFKLTLALWLIFLLIFAEEPYSLARAILPVADLPKSQNLRVISLNCNSGDPLIASEVAPFKPDIVLLQKSPSRDDVNKLARQLYGNQAAVLWGVDGSIIARGTIKPRPLASNHSVYFVQGRVRLPEGYEIEVASLRLMTPPFRIDLWSSDCWNAYTKNRQIQRSQMEVIQQHLQKYSDVPIVVGGDFNAPQGDAVFNYLTSLKLQDSFRIAGRGWGNTIINDFPALRIDQIWASEHLEAHKVLAHKTVSSDHRAVISDFRRK